MDEALLQILNNQQHLNEKLLNNNMGQVLPSIDPPIFKGDFSKYREFLISFETNIERNCNSDIQKLHYLMKYTEGEPNTIVRS